MRTALLIGALLCLTGRHFALAEDEPAPFTLEQAVLTALEQHPAVQATEHRTEAARERLAQRRSQKSLLADFDLSTRRYDWLQPNKEKILGGGSTDVYADLGIRKLLYSGGRVEAQVSATELGLFRSLETDRRVRQQVVYGVAKTYYQLVE
ncbi:MAG: hypothetical protein COY42_22950, partial [Armatimonadetes bacterium CG_4_10_14_0_8_um_filter_66_14]